MLLKSLITLCEYCEFLREIDIRCCDSITRRGISSAIRRRPTLTSISLAEIVFRGNNEGAEITSDFVNSLASLKGLTEINLSVSVVLNELLCSIAKQGFPLKKLILRYCCKYTFTGIFHLLSKCQSVQHLDLENNNFLTDKDVVNLSGFLRNLTFINLNGCQKVTESSFLTLARSCPLLNEIMMKNTKMGHNAWRGVDSKDLVVNSQIKTLHLGYNYSLKDKNIKTFASICPNLEYLDLKSCSYISERGVAQVLKKCSKIRHLNLALCPKLTSLFDEINFHFLLPNLEVLDLSSTSIDDKSLSLISCTCCGLTHLDLQRCFNVTANGVKQVVQNCTRLREIYLQMCKRVKLVVPKCTRLRKIYLWKCTRVRSDNIVYWMVISRPSLRKIGAPPDYVPTVRDEKLFLRRGCLVC